VTLESVEGWVFILKKVDHRGIYQVGSSSDELSNSMHQVLSPNLALSILTTTSDDSSSSITGLVMLTWRNYASSKSFKLSMDGQVTLCIQYLYAKVVSLANNNLCFQRRAVVLPLF
jgi:hypothetical protein